MLRGSLIYLSEQSALKSVMDNPLTRPLIDRFVAGETLQDAIAAVQLANSAGMTAALDLLGEAVHNAADANAAAATYIGLLHAMERADVLAYASLKPTQMGLALDPALAQRNIERVVAQAAQFGRFVRVDMEGSNYTDATLDLVKAVHRTYDNVGVVIQAYLYRSDNDIRELNAEGIQVRLCKGAYLEPDDIAFPKKADTDANYVKLMQLLLSQGNYPAIATHDEAMIDATKAFAAEKSISRDAFEFQMLYGIRRDLQEQLVHDGYRVRVYMPYGTEWYPYFMRRLAERPANMLFVLSNMVKR